MNANVSIEVDEHTADVLQTRARVANERVERTDVLGRHPKLGRAIAGREEDRERLLQVLGGTYAFQYRYDGGSILMLRVFQRREAR